MVLTEDEAGKIICPYTLSNPQGPSNCVASKCMAWRKKHNTTTDGKPCYCCGLVGE